MQLGQGLQLSLLLVFLLKFSLVGCFNPLFFLEKPIIFNLDSLQNGLEFLLFLLDPF